MLGVWGWSLGCGHSGPAAAPLRAGAVRPGIDVLLTDSVALVRGRRVGLVANPAAVDAQGVPTLARLREAGIRVTTLFGPEHGVSGRIDVDAPVEQGRTIDSASGLPVYALHDGVRPIAFEKGADGSTKRMFVQISELHGFAVVDFATHQEIARITLPDVPGVEKNLEGVQGSPSHGIGVTPDGKTLWATSKWYGYVFAYSMPDLKLLGGVKVGMDPDWLTFTPDSKSVYVACAGSNWVSVIDVKSIKEVTRIAVGQVPKRNITALLQ